MRQHHAIIIGLVLLLSWTTVGRAQEMSDNDSIAVLNHEDFVLEVQYQVHIPCLVKLIERVGLGGMLKGLKGEKLVTVLLSDEMSDMLRYQLGDQRYYSSLKQILSFYDSLYDKVRKKPQPMRRAWYGIAVSKCS